MLSKFTQSIRQFIQAQVKLLSTLPCWGVPLKKAGENLTVKRLEGYGYLPTIPTGTDTIFFSRFNQIPNGRKASPKQLRKWSRNSTVGLPQATNSTVDLTGLRQVYHIDGSALLLICLHEDWAPLTADLYLHCFLATCTKNQLIWFFVRAKSLQLCVGWSWCWFRMEDMWFKLFPTVSMQ